MHVCSGFAATEPVTHLTSYGLLLRRVLEQRRGLREDGLGESRLLGISEVLDLGEINKEESSQNGIRDSTWFSGLTRTIDCTIEEFIENICGGSWLEDLHSVGEEQSGERRYGSCISEFRHCE
ncbi:hypothetical protein Bca4012_026117 [Brassica carinata]